MVDAKWFAIQGVGWESLPLTADHMFLLYQFIERRRYFDRALNMCFVGTDDALVKNSA